MSDPAADTDAVFATAIEIPSPTERQAYLQRACAGDPDRLRRLERLLAAHFSAGTFLESPAAGLAAGVLDDPPPLGVGSTIGPYTLVELIGEGGMGSVFRASQSGPVQREVAIKVIKLGMDTREVIARFDAERQALAIMDHPNIAKVFDAGSTGSGRPYFVMELVRGVPVTRFCDESRLTVNQRLELFAQVCRAVQHAHQKGVIHRDIKPSNILVSSPDGQPLAKIIDFGIAKATAARLTQKTLFTEFAQFVGTPEYVSPEQAAGEADIDTRTDVYSLGVLLYELLVGTPPFDGRELRSKAYAEMQRVIREVDPPTPSTRLSALEALPSIAAQRGLEPRRLAATVRGELDWIVMRCLAKDRARRYDSAGALVEDVRRFLDHEPVWAGPPSPAYRLRKFVRRHRATATGAALVALLLIGGITGTSIGLLEAREQRDEARRQRIEAERANDNTQAVNDFLTDQILGAADPRVTRGREISVKEALDIASAKVAGMFAEQPLTEAAVRNTLAVTYHSLGRADLGLPHAQAALDIRRRHLGNDHPDTLVSINHLGLLLRTLGRADETEPLWREAVATGRRTFGPDDLKTLNWTFNLAHLVEDRGNVAEAELMYRDVLAKRRTALGDDHNETLVTMNRLGGLLMEQGRFEEAERLLVEALDRRRRTLGSDHPDTLNSINDVALLRQNQRRFDECESLSREALEGYRRVLGEDHPFTLASLNNMGSLLLRSGRAAEAELFLREATERSGRTAGTDHPRTLIFLANLGTARARQGKFSEAEADLLAADRGLAAAQGIPPSRRERIAEELVTLYTAWDQAEPGKGYHDRARDWRRAVPATRPGTATSPSTQASRP